MGTRRPFHLEETWASSLVAVKSKEGIVDADRHMKEACSWYRCGQREDARDG